MLKYIILFLLFIVTAVIPQRGMKPGPEADLRKPVLIESNFIPSDSSYNCYFSFKIPFNNMLFLKDGNNYSGEISLKLEVHKKDSYLKSETVNRKITVNDYNLTVSNNDYLEGLLRLNLEEGEYNIKPSVSIGNLNRDILLPPFPLTIKSDSLYKIFKPIPVYNEKYTYKNKSYFRLVNSSGVIPYSINNYALIIPVADENISEITVVISQNEKEILNKNIEAIKGQEFNITELNNAVVLAGDANTVKTNMFLVDNFSSKLKEGKAKLIVKYNNYEKEFDIKVGWLNKPLTLRNPEFAIHVLENVTPNDDVDDLTDGNEEDYYKNLVNYWESFDQNKSTAFNEVMNEFYQRADYAVKEFSTPNKRDGTNTDRGKIYIKYGSPDIIDRSYNDEQNVMEIWKYKNLNKRFVFTDRDGLGNFTLLK